LIDYAVFITGDNTLTPTFILQIPGRTPASCDGFKRDRNA